MIIFSFQSQFGLGTRITTLDKTGFNKNTLSQSKKSTLASKANFSFVKDSGVLPLLWLKSL